MANLLVRNVDDDGLEELKAAAGSALRRSGQQDLEEHLPQDWADLPSPISTQRAGTRWMAALVRRGPIGRRPGPRSGDLIVQQFDPAGARLIRIASDGSERPIEFDGDVFLAPFPCPHRPSAGTNAFSRG